MRNVEKAPYRIATLLPILFEVNIRDLQQLKLLDPGFRRDDEERSRGL
jgi:hypothetical protein